MKRTIFKMFGVIVALCIFLGVMPVTTFAENDGVFDDGKFAGIETVEGISVIEFNPETEIVVPEKNSTATEQFFANQFYSGTADTPYLFYNQLTDTQKIVYDTVKANPLTQTIKIEFPNYIIGTGATTEEAVTSAKALISETVIAGLSALAEDNPIIFWMDGFGYNFGYYPAEDSGTQIVGVPYINLTLAYDTNSHASFDDIITKTNLLIEEVENFQVNGISRYEKVKSIHDSLCALVTYPAKQGTFSDGSPWYGPMAHEPTGALLSDSTYGNGHYAVCEGYAEAFKLICDREGIPCITILGTGSGGGHKWNYVKMDDNKWYLLDATWDDQVTNSYHSYMLIGSTTKAPYFESSTPDSEVHIPIGQMYGGVDFALIYPTLSDEAYSLITLGGTPAATPQDIAFDSVNHVIYTGKAVTNLTSGFAVPTGYSKSVSSSTAVTGTTFSITKPNGTTVSYIGAMRGDINASNTVTSDDYTLVFATASAKNKVTDGTAKFYAGDMNHDGAIDGFDAIALDLYMNDMISFD